MKPALIFAALLVAVLNGLIIALAVEYHIYIATAALVLSLIVVALSLAARAGTPAEPAAAPQPIAPPPAPVAPVQDDKLADRSLITLLGLFQEKGRMVDFLMEDITAYDDAQVGAVGRVVHQGCREVLREYFRITPVAQGTEGSPVTVPAGFAPDEYRLVGKIAGEAPFTGTLVHQGWKTASVKLPRPLSADPTRLPAIAPAEVELK